MLPTSRQSIERLDNQAVGRDGFVSFTSAAVVRFDRVLKKSAKIQSRWL